MTDCVGKPVSDLDTPALLVDAAVLRRNIESMQANARRAGLELRPHIKAHKSPELAKMQLAAGAVGVTAAKVSEAEAMADGGVDDIFIANQIVGDTKVRRMADLARRVKLSAAADSVEVAEGYSRVFAGEGLCLDVLIEIDIGTHRCGVLPEAAPELAMRVAELPGIKLVGLMAYVGYAYETGSVDGFAAAGGAEGRLLADVAERLRADGHEIHRLSGGTSPTGHFYEPGCGLTEFRSGTYVLNDMTQVHLGVVGVEDCSATVLATVISVPGSDRMIVDSGAKALAPYSTRTDPSHAWVADDLGATVYRLNDEHAYVSLREAAGTYRVGDKVRLIPARSVPTANLHDTLYLHEGGVVVRACPITARGKCR
jgi:D-serine deaminase-like pyridoxal phosphate-dependent protein